ncbi:hypothetical protein IRJ41_014121 [Triplophysa rosa]|uniref:Uncharacterized protein n=1 Tax=Triplophysa rosa TaxID=992332 RepID=A0A9W7X5Z9_TRIRA|nr:hypothetical protein IRJ41_014121 [Triplophysa rosa]
MANVSFLDSVMSRGLCRLVLACAHHSKLQLALGRPFKAIGIRSVQKQQRCSVPHFLSPLPALWTADRYTHAARPTNPFSFLYKYVCQTTATAIQGPTGTHPPVATRERWREEEDIEGVIKSVGDGKDTNTLTRHDRTLNGTLGSLQQC